MRFAWLFLLCVPLCAQPLRVYSEFARIDASGDVTAPAEPREILSPALVRNGFTSFQVVVQVTKGTRYDLYIGQNPENAVRVTMYRESGDALEPVQMPYRGDASQVFWMDLWTDRDATVQRIKVEPQLNVNDDWVIYPMEARIMPAVVPDGKPPAIMLPPAEVMRSYLCPTTISVLFGPGPSVQNLRSRNAQQDVALAELGSKDELLKLFGACDAPGSTDPEWYFRIRDYLFRLR